MAVHVRKEVRKNKIYLQKGNLCISTIASSGDVWTLQCTLLSSLYHDLSETPHQYSTQMSCQNPAQVILWLAFASSTEHDTYLEGLRTTGDSTICDNMHARIYRKHESAGAVQQRRKLQRRQVCVQPQVVRVLSLRVPNHKWWPTCPFDLPSIRWRHNSCSNISKVQSHDDHIRRLQTLNGSYRVLCHAPDEVCTTSSFCSLVYSLAVCKKCPLRQACSKWWEVNSDQSVIIEQVEHLIKKTSLVDTDKTEKIVKVSKYKMRGRPRIP